MSSLGIGIYSMNVRGLGDKFKRNQVFSWLKNHSGAIYFLQETHSTKRSEQLWKDEWGSQIYFCHGNSNSRGVCILVNNNCDLTVYKEFYDNDGRVIILDAIIMGQQFTLINIYGPNNDNPTFFDNIEKTFNNFDCESVIMGGDFNFVLDVSVDKKGGKNRTNYQAQGMVKNIMESHDLIDVWRELHPNIRQFTWRSYNPSVQCRLDFFLVSFNLYSQIDKCAISPGFKTDHSLIHIHIVPVNEARGPGFWKFNVSLLHEPDYVELAKKCIFETKKNDINMNPSMLWEFMKCQVRTVTMQFSAKISKQRKKYERELTKKLVDLENNYANNPSDAVANEIHDCKNNIEQIYNYKIKGCMIRSRAKMTEFGEKNSRYFINLEKRNQKNKVITKLETSKGDIVINANDILKEQVSFYSKLYSTSNPPECNIEDLLPHDSNCPKLDDNQKDSCEGLITRKECLNALKTMPNNRTPGCDGFSSEWYKFFFTDIEQTVIDSFNYAFHHGKLSADQRRGVINLIPKKDKNPIYLKNWRPISLLNTDYKLLAKCIALRVKRVLPNVINGDQTGFLKGRFIGENIRLALDIIDYLNSNNLPGLMFMIDFEKAFDKLEWPFIIKALKYFNFGSDIVKWVQTFYNDTLSCVTNNGKVSDFFNLFCGVRQGCPLSPYLYIICGEILSIAIRDNNDIEGINIFDSIIKINSYADDTTLYLKNVHSLFHAITVLDNFKMYSGLKVNLDKSELLPLGSYKTHPPDISKCNMIFSKGAVRYLGVTFSTDLNNIFELNFLPKFQKLKNILRVWSMRDLSPLGKITIIKSLGLSQLIFLLSVLPDPPSNFIKELDDVVYKFIWSGKPDKIKRNTIINDYNEGGLCMCHIPSMIKGLKIAWVKRLINNENNGKWKLFFNYHLKPYNSNLIWHCNLNPADKKILSIKNPFIRDVVHAWCNLVFETNPNNPQNQILWNNSFIRIDKDIVCMHNWYNQGVKYVKDLLNDNGDFLTFNEFCVKYSLKNCNYMNYFSLIYAIPITWRRNINDVDRTSHSNTQNDYVIRVCKMDKVCKGVHKLFVKRIMKPPIAEIKWALYMNDMNLNWAEFYTIPLKSSLSTKLRYFQFQLLHRYLPVNKFLYNLNIIDNNLCSFCKQDVESFQHLFWDCGISSSFWRNVQNIILKSNPNFDKKDILLGIIDSPYYTYNFVILHAKYYLYCCRCKKVMPNIYHFANQLKFNCAVEREIALSRDKLDSWNRKWEILKL